MSIPYSKTIRKLRDLGTNKKGVFVCNLILKKSFEVGDKVDYKYDFENRVLTVLKNDKGTHKISFRKSEPDMPILDIKNQTVFELFKEAEKVEVCFYENRIEIKLSKVEKLKRDREDNTKLSIFEFFSGGSTMSAMFRQGGGFVPVGGVEINENCLALAEYNHDTYKYTILADIKDVHPSDYPRNVNICLVGFPCQPFSIGRLDMNGALKRDREGIATEEDKKLLDERFEAEALMFYILEALRYINPQTIVFEEVNQFSSTNACNLLRSVLKTMGYKITETVSEGSHTKRKRWALVATALKEAINLDNLLPQTNKTIEDFLDIKSEDREWKPKEAIQRIANADRKASIGIRYCLPSDKKVNTFTTHKTRSSEPCLKKSEHEDLYSEFTDNEIAKIHGLKNYKLKSVSKYNRMVLGNGVTDMFEQIARRIKQAMIKEYKERKNIIESKATFQLVA